MEKQLIALAFSDHHLANWKQHNEGGKRLHNAGVVPLQHIFNEAHNWDVPILFTGDLVDHPKRVDNVVLSALATTIHDHLGTGLIGINGNHDIPRQSSYKDTSIGYMNALASVHANIHCVDNTQFMWGINHHKKKQTWFQVHGIPYFHGDNGFLEALEDRVKKVKQGGADYNILLIHRDLAGAVEPTGEVLPKDSEQDKPMKKLFKHFDLVLSGHIHKAQPIKALGKHVYMLGATNQQRRSDMGQQCGYWAIYLENKELTMEFIPLDTPVFKTYIDGEEPGDDYNYWIKLPKDTVAEDIEEGNDAFNADADRVQMVNAYFEAKGITDKKKRRTALKYLS